MAFSNVLLMIHSGINISVNTHTDKVFPEPVMAMPTMSRPLRAIGQPWAWIGVGSLNPALLQEKNQRACNRMPSLPIEPLPKLRSDRLRHQGLYPYIPDFSHYIVRETRFLKGEDWIRQVTSLQGDFLGFAIVLNFMLRPA